MLQALRNRFAAEPTDTASARDARESREYRSLTRIRIAHAVPVREPLVLVSQIQRSGGTLLSRLFDGHPECHAHPQELKIGHPRKHHWPPIDLDRPETWFKMLYEKGVVKYRKQSYWTSPPTSGADLLPFMFSPPLQRALFDICVANRDVESERDVLDCYFTAYFNAWLDNHNLYTRPKRVVTGFVPRLSMNQANVERFFGAYPDGTLISVIRDPRGWYASARGHRTGYEGVDGALDLWRHSAEAALDAHARRPERVVVLVYEDLVRETEAVMEQVARRIGITMSPALLVPTFNGWPIRANSSAGVEQRSVAPERADAWREELDERTTERIEDIAGDLYERHLDVARGTAAPAAGSHAPHPLDSV